MTSEASARIACALCSAPSSGSGLAFLHERRGEQRWLEIRLCENCGNHLEKHLKRAIPKRLFETASAESGDPTRTLFHQAGASAPGRQ